MNRSFDEFNRPPPVWKSIDNPTLEHDATAALRSALAETEEDEEELGTTAALWNTFQRFIIRYQYGNFMDKTIGLARSRIEAAIRESEYESLRSDAVTSLREEIREKLTEQIRTELRPAIETKLRVEMRSSVRALVVEQLNGELIELMKPAIENQLKRDLMQDQEFIAEVKAEMQRKILGI